MQISVAYRIAVVVVTAKNDKETLKFEFWV